MDHLSTHSRPLGIFTTEIPWTSHIPTGAKETLVVYCSDKRGTIAIPELVSKLGIAHFFAIAIPGPTLAFMHVERKGYMRIYSYVVRECAKFLIHKAHIEEVVLIHHDDCRWKQEHGMDTHEHNDIQLADTWFKRFLPQIGRRYFLMHPDEQGMVAFKELPSTP